MFLDGPLFEAEMRYFLDFNDLLIAFVDEVVSEPEFLSVLLSAGVDVQTLVPVLFGHFLTFST